MLSELLSKKHNSNNAAAARALHQDWCAIVGDERTVSVDSLATRIGQLRAKGDVTGWWERNPELQRLLAENLEVEVREIFELPRGGDDHPIVFREFPTLPPLERRDSPCRTRLEVDRLRGSSLYEMATEWLGIRDGEPPADGTVFRVGQRCLWLYARPGCGKTLTIQMIQQRLPQVAAMSVSTLSQVLHDEQRRRRPMVVEIERDDGDTAAIVDRLSGDADLVVLAPFVVTGVESVDASALLFADSPGLHVTSRVPMWIRLLLGWIERRVENSLRDFKFDREELLEYLEARPEVTGCIKSPGDLLALCADFDALPAPCSLGDRARRWLTSVATTTMPDAPRAWVESLAAKSFSEMVKADFDDHRVPLGQRPKEEWSAVVSESSAPTANILGREMVVEHMRMAGWLRECDGFLRPYPTWVAAGLRDDHVASVSNKPVEWGRLAADESRQAEVDRGLDALTPAKLKKVARSTIAPDLGLLASVAAFEAVTAAVARRLNSDTSALTELSQVAQELLFRQLATVDDRELPLIQTRQPDEWYATGWTISLLTAKPTGASKFLDKLTHRSTWAVPGWVNVDSLSLDDVIYGASQLPTSGETNGRWTMDESGRALTRLAPTLVARMSPRNVPPNVQRALLAALFEDSRWTLQDVHLQKFARSWDAISLSERARDRPAEERTTLAERWWGIPGGALTRRFDALGHHLSEFVHSNLPDSCIEETVREVGLDEHELAQLRPSHRTAALRAWFTRTPSPKWHEARGFVAYVDVNDLELIVELLRSQNEHVIAEFAGRIWRDLPDTALEEAQRLFDAGEAAAHGWFGVAPREYLGSLLAIAKTAPETAWLAKWGRHRMLDGGPHAQELFELSKRK